MTTSTFKRRGTKVLLSGPSKDLFVNIVEYTGFPIGELPKRFAFIYNEEKEQDGITSWFNFKGWTFIKKADL